MLSFGSFFRSSLTELIFLSCHYFSLTQLALAGIIWSDVLLLDEALDDALLSEFSLEVSV